MKRYYYKFSLSLKDNLLNDPKFVYRVLNNHKYRFLRNNLVYIPYNSTMFLFIRVRNSYKQNQLDNKKFRIKINLRNLTCLQKMKSCLISKKSVVTFSNLEFVWCSFLNYLLFLCRFVKTIGQANFLIKTGQVLVNGKVIRKVQTILKPGDIVTFFYLDQQLLLRSEFHSKYKTVGVFVIIPFFVEISFSTKSFVFLGLSQKLISNLG